MKLLVLATNYPKPDGSVSLQYIHSRNQQYVQSGIDVSVISFDTDYDYEIDQVNVYTLATYEKELKYSHFDILVSHAPNLRNHYRFLKKYGDLYKQFVFFFHGHEVLKINDIYPVPYDYMEKTPMTAKLKRQVYDQFKLLVWRHYFKKIADKSHFVFVSDWMYQMFLRSVKIPPQFIENRKSIIYNCVGKLFETSSYNLQTAKAYDFITIRNNLDGSKYAIDVVSQAAKDNPQFNFCVIGQGDYYNYHAKPANLTWVDNVLNHSEIIDYLNQSKCALIPTRVDSQGVMTCEFATFGIPVITSDIAVCTEVFNNFPNVGFINNEAEDYHQTLEPLFNQLREGLPYEKNTSYFSANTTHQEIQLFNTIIKQDKTEERD